MKHQMLASFLAASAALLAGCGASPTPAPTAAVTGKPSSAPQADAPPAVRAEDPGRYTSLQADACKVLKVDREVGGSTSACPGAGGFQVLVQDSDARMSLDVVAPGSAVTPLQLASLAGGGAFSSLGSRVEWRPSSDAPPTALIVRFDAYEQPERPDVPTSYLVVAKLDAGNTCAVARVDPGLEQNVQAREIADRASDLPCMEAPGG